jgi:hypothetical protein
VLAQKGLQYFPQEVSLSDTSHRDARGDALPQNVELNAEEKALIDEKLHILYVLPGCLREQFVTLALDLT